MLTPQYRKGLVLLLAFLCVYFAIELALNLNRPYWGDEEHFAATVRLFAQNFSIDTIQHYNEMSTPLPFILYAGWGRIFGAETQTLRIFSLLLALLTYLSLYHLLFSTLLNARAALLTTVFIALNPYMLAFSIFVFTDMAALLFLVLCCIAVKEHHPILFLGSAAAALLSRQYLIFVPLAAIAYYLTRWVWLREQAQSQAVSMIATASASFLPLLILFGIWRGPNPDNLVQQLYIGESFRFHPNSLTLYISLLFVYLLPVVLLNVRTLFSSRRAWIGALGASWLYTLFPVQPSQVSIDVDIDTVGFFHRAIRFMLGIELERWIFFLTFVAGLVIAFVVVMDVYSRWRRRDTAYGFFLGMSILAFFVIMPFSYLGWEKYFLPAVPIAAIWMLLLNPSQATNAGA